MGGQTLSDYVKAKRREDCKVCKLPDSIRAQIAGASDKKIKRNVVLDWLKDEHNVSIRVEEMAAHTNGRHDA